MSIFNLIEKISQSIAKKFDNAFNLYTPNIDKQIIETEYDIEYLNELEEYNELFYYASYASLSQIFDFLLISICTLLFAKAYALNVLVCMICYLFMRSKSGGYHSDSFKRCTTSTLTYVFLMTFVSVIGISNFYLFFILSMLISIYIVSLAPVESENSQSRGDKEDLSFRKHFANILIIFSLINILIIYLTNNSGFNLSILVSISSSISSSIICISLILTNGFKYLMTFIFRLFRIYK